MPTIAVNKYLMGEHTQLAGYQADGRRHHLDGTAGTKLGWKEPVKIRSSCTLSFQDRDNFHPSPGVGREGRQPKSHKLLEAAREWETLGLWAPRLALMHLSSDFYIPGITSAQPGRKVSTEDAEKGQR